MTWFRVDDGLAVHAKVVTAGNAAMGLWVRAGAWSAQQLTDGFVPDHMIPVLGNRAQARALVKAGLWLDADGGYRFWQWNQRNPTRSTVEADREAARERMAKQRRNNKGEFADSSPEQTPNTRRSSESVRPPRPVPSVVKSSSSQSRNVTRPSNDDLDRIVNQLAGLRPRHLIDRDWAAKVHADIRDRTSDDIRNWPAYIAKCIRDDPDRYLPTHVPPLFVPPVNPTGPPASDVSAQAAAARKAAAEAAAEARYAKAEATA